MKCFGVVRQKIGERGHTSSLLERLNGVETSYLILESRRVQKINIIIYEEKKF
jgi:hypothetical protein